LDRSAGDSAFASWVQQVAQTEHLRVGAWASGQLDSDEAVERAALLCDPAGATRGFWIVEKDPTHRWAIAFQLSQSVDCPAAKEWVRLNDAVEVAERTARGNLLERVALRDGVPALLSTDEQSAEGKHAVAGRDEAEEGALRRTGFGTGAAWSPFLAVTDVATASVPGSPTFAIFGANRRTGADDARLTLEATRQADGTVRARVSTTDDVRLTLPAGATDHAFLASDHLELWWTEPESPGCVPRSNRLCGVKQLGIAFQEGGGLDVRWLYPVGLHEALPRVIGDPAQVEVDLPAAAFAGTEAIGWRSRFTAAYSDSDVAGGEQEKLIATSRLRWGKAETFGQVAVWPGRRRFAPPAAGAIFCDAWRIPEGHRLR
jgi:hypothetical protein